MSNKNISEIQQIGTLFLSANALGSLVKAVIDNGNSIRFRVKGNSMFPFILNGATVMVSPCKHSELNRGDIVAFIDSNSNNLVIHRLLKIGGSLFESKGDNCIRGDMPQPVEKIIGRITKIHNRNGLLCNTACLSYGKFISFFSEHGITAIVGKLLLFFQIKHFQSVHRPK